MEQVAYPIRTLAMLGIEIAILTNSAGGLDPNMKPGDLMVIEDHINMMGNNPLMGPILTCISFAVKLSAGNNYSFKTRPPKPCIPNTY